jgi:uncharacterized protein
MIYLDSCIAIYLTEDTEQFSSQIATQLSPQSDLCISALVELECLVQPIREKRSELVAAYKSQFADYRNVEISKAVYQSATELRAAHGLKVPDALHLACAHYHRCTEFWTHDAQLNKVAKLLNMKTLDGLI